MSVEQQPDTTLGKREDFSSFLRVQPSQYRPTTNDKLLTLKGSRFRIWLTKMPRSFHTAFPQPSGNTCTSRASSNRSCCVPRVWSHFPTTWARQHPLSSWTITPSVQSRRWRRLGDAQLAGRDSSQRNDAACGALLHSPKRWGRVLIVSAAPEEWNGNRRPDERLSSPPQPPAYSN